MSQRRCKRPFHRPTMPVDAFADCVLVDAYNVSPVSNTTGFAMEREQAVPAGVSGLCLTSRPDAVPGGVRTAVVLPFDGMIFGWSGANVIAEGCERRPPFADCDPPAPVVGVGVVIRPGASSDYSLPDVVKVSSVASVNGSSPADAIVSAGAASLTFLDLSPSGCDDSSARASTGPAVPGAFLTCVVQDGEVEEYLAGEVLESGIGRHSNSNSHGSLLHCGLWSGSMGAPTPMDPFHCMNPSTIRGGR